jgi:hypothetical protein
MEDISPTSMKPLLNGFSSRVSNNNKNIHNIARIGAELAIDNARYMCGTAHAPINRYAPTMRRCVEEMLIKHQYLFNGMVSKLDVNMDNISLTLNNVVEELFRDGAINWGRIVSVYAFTGRLAHHLVLQNNTNTENVIRKVSETCGLVVETKLKDWIEKQGGWVCIHFVISML